MGNPYNPYYWVDDHPRLYGNNGSLDGAACGQSQCRTEHAPSTGGGVMTYNHVKPNMQNYTVKIIQSDKGNECLEKMIPRIAYIKVKVEVSDFASGF